jgi:hypothetical protein
MRGKLWTWALAAVAAGATAGCDEAAAPSFPADYAASFTLVRGCRSSGDHELHRIRVLADPAALASYTSRAARFPEGAVVLKEEYDFADSDCRGPILEWTVMRRLAGGERGGWAWQRVSAGRQVESEDEPRCIGCHQQCGVAPDGHDGTCAVP